MEAADFIKWKAEHWYEVDVIYTQYKGCNSYDINSLLYSMFLVDQFGY